MSGTNARGTGQRRPAHGISSASIGKASSGSPIAHQAIKQIAQLYAVEKEARGKSPEERVALRQAKAKPVFDNLELWLQAQLCKISGKIKLAEAIRYALSEAETPLQSPTRSWKPVS